MQPKLFYAILILFLIKKEMVLSDNAPELRRQKRCIVVQKQSGTHGDSTEGDGDGGDDDEDYRRPQNKEPKPDKIRRLNDRELQGLDDVESLSRLMKYNILPVKRINSGSLRTKNRFNKNY